MSHLWVEHAGSGWLIVPLAGPCRLAPSTSAPLIPLAAGADGCRTPAYGIELHRVSIGNSAGTGQWLLLVEPQAPVSVNGEAVRLGMRVLRDRDEILVLGEVAPSAVSGPAPGASRYFFSTERLACVEPFPASDHEVFCVRCRQPIRPGSLAVQCPNPACNHWYHEEGDLLCWSYGATCSMCDQSTPLDADYRWTPEDL